MRYVSRDVRPFSRRRGRAPSRAVGARGARAGGGAVNDLARAAIVVAPLALGLGAFALDSVPAWGAPEVPPGVVASVDGEAISRSEFEAFFRRYLRQNLYHGGSEARLREIRSSALDQMILERLVAREVERRGIAGDPQAVDRQIAALEQRYGMSDRWAEVKKKLPVLRQQLLLKSRSDVLRMQIAEIAEPDESQLARYYRENIELFTEPMAWDLSVILVGVPPSALSDAWRAAEARGQELYQQLRAGEDFAALASTESTHESSAAGGVLGLVHKGQLAPEVEAALEAVDVGQVTPPIRVLEGYALFKKEGVRPTRVRSLEQVRERARGLYVREQKKRLWQRFTEELKTNARITLYEQVDAAEQDMAEPPK